MSTKVLTRHSVLFERVQCENKCKSMAGHTRTRWEVAASTCCFAGLRPCSKVKETEKTSGASFILCDAFNVQFYAMGSTPYGCLYRDLYSNDYTQLGVITFL